MAAIEDPKKIGPKPASESPKAKPLNNATQGALSQNVYKTQGADGSATYTQGNSSLRGTPIATKNGAGGGGTLSITRGPGQGAMPNEKWDALPNSEKIKRNVASYESQTSAIRDLRNARRASEGVGPVGVGGTLGGSGGIAASGTSFKTGDHVKALDAAASKIEDMKLSPGRKAAALQQLAEKKAGMLQDDASAARFSGSSTPATSSTSAPSAITETPTAPERPKDFFASAPSVDTGLAAGLSGGSGEKDYYGGIAGQFGAIQGARSTLASSLLESGSSLPEWWGSATSEERAAVLPGLTPPAVEWLNKNATQQYAEGGLVAPPGVGQMPQKVQAMPIVQAYRDYMGKTAEMGLPPISFNQFAAIQMSAQRDAMAQAQPPQAVQQAQQAQAMPPPMGEVRMAGGGMVPPGLDDQMGGQMGGRMVIDPSPTAGTDSIPAMIDEQHPAKIDSGELIFPKDVVLFYGTDRLMKMIEKARNPNGSNSAGPEGPA